jgi:hypothetical protein
MMKVVGKGRSGMPPHWWSVSPQATKLTSAGAAIALLVYLLVAEPLDLDVIPTCTETVDRWRPRIC